MCRTQYAGCGVFIKTVSHNTTSDTNDVTYTFGYDAFGKPTTVSVGSQVLSTNTYDADRKQKLRKVTYGNGQYIENEYDDYDQLIGVKWNGTQRYQYAYGANGQAARVTDKALNRVIWNEYDEANRPKSLTIQDGTSGALLYKTTLAYDDLEHVSKLVENAGGSLYETTYSYDWDDRPTEIRYGSSTQRVKYTYDSQGRMLTRRVVNGNADQTATYSYAASSVAIPGLSTAPSTNLVSGISQPGVAFTYGYASNTDNITSESRTGGSYAGTTTYVYDTLGQLTRVNDPVENATWVYTYDRGGNILNKKKYAYTTGTVGTVQQTITYTYNSAWKDKLATYNGTTLSYDVIGNLTGDGTWTYTWAGGRQLSGMSKSGTAITYGYNNSGLRVRKTVAGVATNYTLNGKLITHLTKGSDWMHFFYDGQGKPSIVNYKGATYRYLYNLQGDVIGLVDTSGNVVVEYKYDAWGKIIARTGSLASTLGYLNPFRYRGYVYDEETGLYYLRSRYYNPEWGRFIAADVVLGATGEVLSHNQYCYCSNNPVAREDDDGDWWLTTICVGVIGQYASDVIGNLISGKRGLEAFKASSSLGDYVSAGITALIPGSHFLGALAGKVISEGISIVESKLNNEEINWHKSIWEVITGTLTDWAGDNFFDLFGEFLNGLRPKNYSSYANYVRKIFPNMDQSLIKEYMFKKDKFLRFAMEAVPFGYDVVTGVEKE